MVDQAKLAFLELFHDVSVRERSQKILETSTEERAIRETKESADNISGTKEGQSAIELNKTDGQTKADDATRLDVTDHASEEGAREIGVQGDTTESSKSGVKQLDSNYNK